MNRSDFPAMDFNGPQYPIQGEYGYQDITGFRPPQKNLTVPPEGVIRLNP